MPARTTAVPRFTGPTCAGRAMARPAGPPSVGPVRKTVPASATGADPLPTSVLTLPTRLSAGQVPASAFASGQVGTPLRLPARPGGSCVVTRLKSCEPSGRERASVTAPAGRPASVDWAVAASAGASGRGEQATPG